MIYASEDDASRSQRRAAWMERAQRGDAEAYRALLNDVGPLIMAFLRRRIADRQVAEDVYQEVFLTLHRARRTYIPPRPVEPWLFAIARHVVSHYRRRESARVAREIPMASPPQATLENDPSGAVQMRQALRMLPRRQREALELREHDGLSFQAAAQRAGTTPGALRVRLHRAHRVLREVLKG